MKKFSFVLTKATLSFSKPVTVVADDREEAELKLAEFVRQHGETEQVDAILVAEA